VTFWICRTCAVEHASQPGVCAICADERQWVPATGQAWATLAELTDEGYEASITELEPDLYAITSTPTAGIGQQSKLVRTPGGNVLWDPIGFLDDAVVDAITSLGTVVAVVASHPHMYGVQVEWSHRLGSPPVLVSESDVRWLARPDPVVGDVDGFPRAPPRAHAQPARRSLSGQRGAALGRGRRRSWRAPVR
jgi:hypothetical protein